jgi:Thrombospondin type 3 repeat
MFGMMSMPFVGGADFGHQGDQVRGFGFLHDGSIDTLFRFFHATVFIVPDGDPGRRDIEAFVLAFDTDLAPIVGQQVTLGAANLAAVSPRIDLLLARAAEPFESALLGGSSRECNVVVKGVVGSESRGWLYETATGQFRPDRSADPALAKSALLALAQAPGQELTFTATPPGSGRRMGIDRDLDAVLDGDDNCPAAANPGQQDADADGVGDVCVPEPGAAAALLAAWATLASLAARVRRAPSSSSSTCRWCRP